MSAASPDSPCAFGPIFLPLTSSVASVREGERQSARLVFGHLFHVAPPHLLRCMIYAIARSVLSQTQPTRTLRAAASSSAGSPPHLPHWVSLANALDDEVLRRPVPKLVAGDDDQVRLLLRAFCDDREHEMWTKAAAHDTSAAAVRCNMVAHFLRALLRRTGGADTGAPDQ